jgi:hypothetical protein
MLSRFLMLATLVLAPLTSFAATPDVYRAIPADALGFLLINRLSETSDKLTKTAQQAQVPAPPLLMLVKQMTGITQLDEDKSAAVVVLPGAAPTAQPRIAFLAPTKDYPKLLAGLGPDDAKASIAHVLVAGRPSIVAKKGSFAVFMGNDPEDEDALEKLLASSTDVGGVIKPLTKWLDSQEIGGVVTPEGMGQFFGQVQTALAMGAATVGPEQQAVFQLLADLIKSLQREVSHFALGLHIDESGVLDLTSRSIFLPAGAFARAAKDAAPVDSDILTSLPLGPFVFAGAGALPESWSDAVAELVLQMTKASANNDMTEEQQTNLTEAMRQLMKGLRGMSLVMGVPKPDEPLYSGMMGFLRVKSSERYMEEQKKSNEALSKLHMQGAVYECALQDVEGFPGMVMTVSPGDGKENPQIAPVLEKLVGANGKTYVAAINPTTIATSYVNSAGIPQLAKRLKSGGPGFVGDPSVKTTAALLPTSCQWTGYVSAAGCVAFARNARQALAPPGQPGPQIPDFPNAPPLGLTAKLLPIGLETHLVVPADTVSAIGAYVRQLQGGPPQ